MKTPFLVFPNNLNESGKLPIIVWIEKCEDHAKNLFEIGKALEAEGRSPDFESIVREVIEEEGCDLLSAVEEANYDLLGNGDVQISEVSIELFNSQKNQPFSYE